MYRPLLSPVSPVKNLLLAKPSGRIIMGNDNLSTVSDRKVRYVIQKSGASDVKKKKNPSIKCGPAMDA